VTTNKLQERIQKKEEEIKELRHQLKTTEAAQRRAEEEAAKLESLSPAITEAIEALLKKEKLTLPAGKQIITTVGETGLLTNIVNGKTIKASTGKGNGGAKAITYEGEQTSWAGLAELKGIARTPGGSAHRDVFNKSRELHDSIEHECSIDGKKYPVS
jgi:hypothetical protein